MTRIGWIILFVAICFTSCYRPSAKQAFDDLKVFEGKWRTIDGPDFIEVWEIANDSLLSGVGLSMNGTDTSFKELLQIYRNGDSIYYGAKVGNNVGYVPFRLDENKKNYWMFINLEHDYPNIIEYSLLNDSMLQARTMNLRKKKEIKFVMRKVKQ